MGYLLQARVRSSAASEGTAVGESATVASEACAKSEGPVRRAASMLLSRAKGPLSTKVSLRAKVLPRAQRLHALVRPEG